MKADEHLEKVAQLAVKQFGVVAAWQAEQAGLSRDQFDRLIADGKLKRYSRGVYSLPGSTRIWEQRVWAACLAAKGVASHRTAAWLWKLDGVNASEPRKLELVAPFGKKGHAPGVRVHRSRSLVDAHRRLVRGVPCTTLARTIVDLSQVLSEKALDLAVASAVRLEPRVFEQVETMLAPLPQNAVVRLKRLMPLLEERDEAVDSALEALVRRFLRRAKFPEPKPQVRIFDGNALIARVDFAWPANKPPVALLAHGERYHGNTTQWLRDLQQASELNEIGWRVIQCSMSDVEKRPVRLAQMLRRALAGYRGDGVYRDEYLRDPENDSFAVRSSKARRL